MAKGIYDGWSALRTGLSGIGGSGDGYWNDYAGRVYERLVLPVDDSTLPDYYLCIPFIEDEERFEEQDQHLVVARWVQTIFAFVRETSTNPLESGAIELVAKIRDDLVRYFLENPTLDGAVKSVRMLTCLRTAGWTASDDYGELSFQVEIKQVVDSGDLGPDA